MNAPTQDSQTDAAIQRHSLANMLQPCPLETLRKRSVVRNANTQGHNLW